MMKSLKLGLFTTLVISILLVSGVSAVNPQLLDIKNFIGYTADEFSGFEYGDSPDPDSCGAPLDGWPYIAFKDTNAVFTQPAVGEFDSKPGVDLISFATYSPIYPHTMKPGIYAFHSDGTEVKDGDLDSSTIGFFRGNPADDSDLYRDATLAQLDSDKEMELVYHESRYIQALNGDGSAVAGWPYTSTLELRKYVYPSIVAADINGDGIDEVMVSSAYDEPSGSQYLIALGSNGKPLPGWPAKLTMDDFGVAIQSITVADVVKDSPGLEIIVSSNPNAGRGPHNIIAFSSTGERLWVQKHPYAASIATVDADSDGDVEVVVLNWVNPVEAETSGDFEYSVEVLSGETGETIWNYEVKLGPYTWEQYIDEVTGDRITKSTWAYVTPEGGDLEVVLADLNKDGKAEILVSDRYYMRYNIKHTDGSKETTLPENYGNLRAITLMKGPMKGFPVRWEYGFDMASAENDKLVDAVAKLSDKSMNIIVSQREGLYKEHVITLDRFGKELKRWTVELDDSHKGEVFYRGFSWSPTAITDLDGDGFAELVKAPIGGELHVLEECVPYDAESVQYGTYRGNVGRTAFFKFTRQNKPDMQSAKGQFK